MECHLVCAATTHSEDQPVTLRTATAADALCLGVLATQVFLDTYAFAGINEAVAHEVRTAFSTAAFTALLTQGSTSVTLAEKGGFLIGFAQSTVGTDQRLAPSGRHAELDRLYVQRQFFGRGIGSLLLNEQETIVARHGVDLLWLSSWVGNRRALEFYARHGYRDLGLAHFEMGEAKIENRVYAKRVPGAAQTMPAPRRDLRQPEESDEP